MFTLSAHSIFRFVPHVIVGLLLGGCFSKPCQQLPDAPFQSITETEWRLVFTTDPTTAQRLNNFNFTILSFSDDFKIQFTSVTNNQQASIPEVTGDYDVVQDSDVIVAKLQDFNGQDLGRVVWFFDVGRKLELVDANTGHTFVFYPFEGIVKPDFQCEFRY